MKSSESWTLFPVLLLFASAAGKVCPIGYSLHETEVCYKIVNTKISWNNARLYCRGDNGALISIHDDRLFQSLRANVLAYGRNLWIGASDSRNIGRLEWEDGKSCCPKSWWNSGEPNSSGEDCVEIDKDKDCGLNDENCGDPGAFACESSGCPDIPYCQTGNQMCTHNDNTCSRCVDNNVFFKLTTLNRKCERLCSWNSHFCWPGHCTDGLAGGCSCFTGFYEYSTSTETSCQLQETNKPSIHTCDTIMVGPNGEKKAAKSTSTSTKCQYLADFYGNFMPAYVTIKYLVEFTIDITNLSSPSYISEHTFGITDMTLHLKHRDVKGAHVTSTPEALITDTSNGASAVERVSDALDVNITSTNFAISNGQRLCIRYEAKGGGYLKAKMTNGTITSTVPYRKTFAVKELCYIFDDAPPDHCIQTGSCSGEPLYVAHRITRSPSIQVEFTGWVDPIPTGGTVSGASGIESYQVSVHEVLASSIPLKVDTENIYSSMVNKSIASITIHLEIDRPKLLCIVLEVKDFADNVKQARRFILYDNSSYVDTNKNKAFFVESASANTEYVWQAHHKDICLNWEDYFFNKVYLDNNFLAEIEADAHGVIRGHFDQNTGVLPIHGTENVHGIIQFEVFSSLNHGTISEPTSISNFTLQRFCRDFGVKDGETYTLTVKATDIAGNTKSDNRSVHIDMSVPHISNVWLIKDGYKRLFVHNSSDLSKMNLYFETLDPHSGILTIEWMFGTSDDLYEIAQGAISINKIKESKCTSENNCYCPDVGTCELYTYVLPMTKLVALDKHSGNHNRNYFFTLKATNHAMLSTTVTVDILVDDSPPETGVVLEGPKEGPEVDFTSDDTLIIHWHGFIDHESGIKLYRIALADRCLQKEEMFNLYYSGAYEIREVLFTESAVHIPLHFTGKMFTTVVALNNAMEMSLAACSDGITRDTTAPLLKNITLYNARVSESILCQDGKVWLLEPSLTKVQLTRTNSCNVLCHEDIAYHDIATVLPISTPELKNEESSEVLCTTLTPLISQYMIYLPHDDIDLRWAVEEPDSQINTFLVGFGQDSSEMSSPSILSYHDTQRHQWFTRKHSGMSSDQMFYIFIKAVNKARLETVYSLGPILIDETPPLCRSIPTVTVVDQLVIIRWQTDSFYDMEQTEQIHRIDISFSLEFRAVTQLMEWRKNGSSPCMEYSGECFVYPVQELQIIDRDMAMNFHATFYVYNKAGHFIKVNSNTFQIPSMYPPGHAIIADVDPADQEIDSNDIDMHFSLGIVCAKWKGFKHHENITLEFAVGDNLEIVNVIPFRYITNTTSHCESSSNILPDVVYYVFLKASCSGGSTISTSNGVRILPEELLVSSLLVHVGKECVWNEYSNHFVKDIMHPSTIMPSKALRVGLRYAVYVHHENYENASIETDEGILDKVEVNDNGLDYWFRPFVERPRMNVKCYNCVKEFTVTLGECPNTRFTSPSTNIGIFWKYSIVVPSIIHKITLHIDSPNEDNFEPIYKTEIRANGNNTHIEIPHSVFSPGESFKVAVQPCIDSGCMNAVLSEVITIEASGPDANLQTAQVNHETGNHCFDITASWNVFKSNIPIVFYQWAVFNLESGKLTRWNTITETAHDSYEIRNCTTLPVHLHKPLKLCVRAFSETGQEGQACKIMEVSSLGEYKTNAIYDFESTADIWTDIIKVLPSKDIGGTSRLLHDAELDFGTYDARVAGAMRYGNGRSVTWYLMEESSVPVTCSKDIGCNFHETNAHNYIQIPSEKIEHNQIYFICAFAEGTNVTREFHVEWMDEMRECSDGFVLDDLPPSQGTVHIRNNAGYLPTLTNIAVDWSGFQDNIDVTQLGYMDDIRSYSYALGSQPSGEDIMPFTDVGLASSVVVTTVNVDEGALVFASVRAKDHAGMSTTSVSEPVIVDTSAPVAGHVIIDCDSGDTGFCSSSSMSVHMTGFSDIESGIGLFEVTIGLHCDIGNIYSNIHMSEFANIQLQLNRSHDGQRYCLTTRAKNRAGLVSLPVSREIVIDTSPPTSGHVLDGYNNNQDSDFEEHITHIRAHWKGFDDVQSGIDYYRVALGLQPYTADVHPMVYVGLRTDITWNATFIPGLKYFTTVEACNHAGLCSTLTSNGVTLDNSPPVRGIVQILSGERNGKFIHTRSTVQIRWFGFEDPQSDIESYEACIGYTPGGCEIVQYFPCLLQSSIIKTGVYLRENTSYYASVKAYNRVGMYVIQSSDEFRVDSTPPELIINPYFELHRTATPGIMTQWDRSFISIAWLFKDAESPITHHIVTVKTHHEGRIPIDHQVVGSVNELTIQLDRDAWLSDGDRYVATVASCNAAGHCSLAEFTDLHIDSTPPHLGGFKQPLLWHNCNTSTGNVFTNLSLTWYGFHDAESTITRYFVKVSQSFGGHELSDGEIAIMANPSSTNDIGEQTENIPLIEAVLPDDMIVLTIWAENQAGLNSSVARVSVFCLSQISDRTELSHQEGSLEIQRHSCDIHFCNKDCTCAVIGKPCTEVISNATCFSLNTTKPYADNRSEIQVFGGLETHTTNITSSSACLTAHWKIIDKDNLKDIERFEWSMGLFNQPVGEGIFDLQRQRPWTDVGLQDRVVHCVDQTRDLLHGHEYVVYVKAWFSFYTFSIFTSAPIAIDHSAPSKRRGVTILDSDTSCNKDKDFSDNLDSITACWKSVFSEQQTQITHYTLALGTSPGADDIFPTVNVGMVDSQTIANMTLNHGTKYYTTVTAYNSVNLHTAVSSDGFIIDDDEPQTGIVFNTDRHSDSLYQHNTDTFTISWHGFYDHYSGIRSYRVALTNNLSSIHYDFVDVGLQTRYTFKGLRLLHGRTYYGLVKAVDAAGHVSKVSVSEGKVIDTTPPEGIPCISYTIVDTMVLNLTKHEEALIKYDFNDSLSYFIQGHTPSFIRRLVLQKNHVPVILPLYAQADGDFHFEHLLNGYDSGSADMSVSIDMPGEETVYLQIHRCTSESLLDSVLRIRQIGPETFSMNMLLEDKESSIYKVLVGVGTTPGGFQMKPLTPVHLASLELISVKEPHNTTLYFTTIAENHAGQRSFFYSQPVVLDKTPPSVTRTPVLSIDLPKHQNSSGTVVDISVSWAAYDHESGIQFCACAIGRNLGATDVRDFEESSSGEDVVFANVSVSHGEVLHAVVRCVNNVELITEMLVDPVIISSEVPNTDLARVDVVPLNSHTVVMEDTYFVTENGDTIFMQSNQTCIQVEWKGFWDVSGIDYYEYRLLQGSTAVGTWKPVGKQTAVENKMSLDPGIVYTAEVRAVNVWHHVSDTISTRVLIEKEEPYLTGQPLKMYRSGPNVNLDWTDLFQKGFGSVCRFDVNVGTKRGYGDVIDEVNLLTTSIDFVVKPTLLSPDVTDIFVSVACTYATGASKTYEKTFPI